MSVNNATYLYDLFTKKNIIFNKSYGEIYFVNDYWSCGPQEDRTWLFILHAFLPFDPIIQVGDAALLKELVGTWCERFESAPEEDDFPWHDHATALRLDRLSRMALELKDCWFDNLAARHAMLLLQESFYSRHTNHGFDQALSLILAALAFSNDPDAKTWKSIGLARLKDEITFAFTDEGVHVENSPAYHMGMISNMIRARNLLEASHIDLGDFDILFDKAIKFLAWMTRPDRNVVYLGDSASYRANLSSSLAHLGNAGMMQWASSGGQEGTAPDKQWMVYEQSGYAIYRSSWQDWRKHTHLIMKCGFLSRYHRQDDDLNILLHALGEDWLIDSGLYNHNQKDPVRIYMRSALAHNVPYLQDIRTDRSTPGENFARLRNIPIEGGRFSAEGVTAMYQGGVVTRKFIVHDTLNFEIIDNFSGFSGKNRYWLFHLPLDKKIVIKDDSVCITGKKGVLKITSDYELTRRVSVGFKKPFPSVLSLKINILEDSQVLVFGPSLESEMGFQFSLIEKS